jgi:hypothetical protein
MTFRHFCICFDWELTSPNLNWKQQKYPFLMVLATHSRLESFWLPIVIFIYFFGRLLKILKLSIDQWFNIKQTNQPREKKTPATFPHSPLLHNEVDPGLLGSLSNWCQARAKQCREECSQMPSFYTLHTGIFMQLSDSPNDPNPSGLAPLSPSDCFWQLSLCCFPAPAHGCLTAGYLCFTPDPIHLSSMPASGYLRLNLYPCLKH